MSISIFDKFPTGHWEVWLTLWALAVQSLWLGDLSYWKDMLPPDGSGTIQRAKFRAQHLRRGLRLRVQTAFPCNEAYRLQCHELRTVHLWGHISAGFTEHSRRLHMDGLIQTPNNPAQAGCHFYQRREHWGWEKLSTSPAWDSWELIELGSWATEHPLIFPSLFPFLPETCQG